MYRTSFIKKTEKHTASDMVGSNSERQDTQPKSFIRRLPPPTDGPITSTGSGSSPGSFGGSGAAGGAASPLGPRTGGVGGSGHCSHGNRTLREVASAVDDAPVPISLPRRSRDQIDPSLSSSEGSQGSQSTGSGHRGGFRIMSFDRAYDIYDDSDSQTVCSQTVRGDNDTLTIEGDDEDGDSFRRNSWSFSSWHAEWASG